MSILALKNVSYQVNELEIVKDISFQINEGDCISIVGQSGSGKSTLLKLCADLLPITKGQIWYKNKTYDNYEPSELRKSISYCVQVPYLFGKTVYDNLAFSFLIRKETVNKERIEELMQTFDLEKVDMEQDIASLSGGEKQRIALMRNLMYVPDILLLDEVTASLDVTNAQRIEQYIKKLNAQGMTVVWITHHEIQSYSIFNKRIVIAEGRLEKMEEIRR